MGHVASAAPTGELLPSPNAGGNGQHDRKVFPYGVGIDCHSKFFEICVHVLVGNQLATYRLRVSADWGQLQVGHEWVLRTLAGHGISVRGDDLRYTLES